MRLLTRDEIELIWTIDRSEVHHHTYELGDGELVRVPNYFEIPGWRPDAAVKETHVLFDRFDRGGTFVGMFDAEALIGISVLENTRVSARPETYPRGDDWAPWSASVGVGGESGLGRYEWMRAPRSPQTDVEIMSAAVKRGRHSSVPGLSERNL